MAAEARDAAGAALLAFVERGSLIAGNAMASAHADHDVKKPIEGKFDIVGRRGDKFAKFVAPDGFR